MKGIGSKVRRKAMVSLSMLLAIFIKDSFKEAKKMERASSS